MMEPQSIRDTIRSTNQGDFHAGKNCCRDTGHWWTDDVKRRACAAGSGRSRGGGSHYRRRRRDWRHSLRASRTAARIRRAREPAFLSIRRRSRGRQGAAVRILRVLSGARAIRRARTPLCDRQQPRGGVPSADAPDHPRLRIALDRGGCRETKATSKLEASASLEIARHTLLSCGLILAIGTLAGLLAQKIRIPDVAVFLVAGIAIGPQAFGLIHVREDSALNQIILLFGASYILFDGGASLRLNVLKQVWITILIIATVGVVITAVITGMAAHYILGIPLIVALLLGATLAATDPATLVPICRQVHIRDRVAQTVMSESAFNDAMGAIVTFGVLAVATGSEQFSLVSSLFDLLKQSVIGIVAGIALGYLAALLIAHEKWAFLAEYAPVVTLVAVIGAYFASDGLQASGFMAVFVFGIVLGNKETFGLAMEPGEAQKLDEFVLTTAFIMRLFIFILQDEN